MNDAPQHSSGGLPKKLVLLIALGISIPFLGAGYLLFNAFVDDEPEFTRVDNYLVDPAAVLARVEAVTEEARRIEISASEIEVYDAEGQRHTISASGSALRRGGAESVPEASFPVKAVNFAGLPKVLAAAEDHSRAAPQSATVEMVGTELLWRVEVRAGQDYETLLLSPEGELRE